MHYRGRIGIVIFTLLSFIAWNNHHEIHIDAFNLLMLVFFIGVGWWLGKQYDKVKFDSQKDPLTGVYNRRFVEEIVPKLMAQANRNNHMLHVSIIDIDNFKAVNDTYGHGMGDKTLQQIAHILRMNTREGDLIARWGGDEFLFVASFTRETPVQATMDRLEKRLQELSNQLQIDISVSIGTAVYPHNGDTLQELIKVADSIMYRLKFAKK